jgi:hypothetical protein
MNETVRRAIDRADDLESVGLLAFLLRTADHAATEIQFNGKLRTLRPGQVIITVRILAKRWRKSRRKIEQILENLEKMGQLLSQEFSRRSRLITITNWGATIKSEPTSEPTAKLAQKLAQKEAAAPSYSQDIAEQIWHLYPRKDGHALAMKAIDKAFALIKPEELRAKVVEFARAIEETWVIEDKRFIPHCSTWMNQKRFFDDPATWRRKDGSSTTKSGVGHNRAPHRNNYITGAADVLARARAADAAAGIHGPWNAHPRAEVPPGTVPTG